VHAGDSRFGYCGGIDINPNRIDDARHLAKGPYHDVHARVQGPAVRDVELSFAERWERDGGGVDLAFEPSPPPAPGDDPAGTDVVQVARTYFRAADPSRALPFAPQGDRTIMNTILRAIESAREFIFIEDQYFTPPDEYRATLLGKVAEREIDALVIVLPAIGDQPFGEIVRSDFIADLRAADGGAGIVRIGYPRRHYTLPANELRASSGRLVLMADLASSGGVDPTVVLGPKARLPLPPFWLAIEGELMYAFNESTAANPDPEHALVFQVVRGAETRLLKGGAAPAGPRTREHKRGAAATVVDLAGIYVHTKMMIVDDVFAGIGSANINKRGLCHDGEINVFSVPQQLKTSRANPVAALRRKLWAEMLDLPIGTAGPLLQDPLAAARLFDRSAFHGSRFTDIEAYPTHLMFDSTSGDGLVLDLLRLVLVDIPLFFDQTELFNAVIDPTSALETA
jgi:phosphatidylserine/phosphatidylglycerophosphate/cardiolipin synthase-like enzyme